MRITTIIIAVSLVFISCNENKKTDKNEVAHLQEVQQNYKSFGEQISAKNSISATEMKGKFENLKPGDTISEMFTAKVSEVCKMKGCWMSLVLPGEEENVMVRFKNYGFFMPKDIEEKEVIVEGLAFIEETSVEDLRHFAEDAGKSQKEINAITEAERTYAFTASGVLLKE